MTIPLLHWLRSLWVRGRSLLSWKTPLGLITLGIYAFFTLQRDSHSYMVSVPWMYVLQGGLILGVLWSMATIWQKPAAGLRWLGGGLDWAVLALIQTLSFSLIFAPFPQPAFWYSLVAIAQLALLYGLFAWFTQPTGEKKRRGFLRFQGFLAMAWLGSSFYWWFQKTVAPEWARLARLAEYGIHQGYNLNQLELRNWAPFGHPNYGAGYILLVLPIFVGLACAQRWWDRWFWGLGGAIALACLYTTSSRGGWLGLAGGLGVVGVLLWQKRLCSRRILQLSAIACGGMMGTWVLQSDRLRRTFTGILTLGQQGGEFSYRYITHVAGLKMGFDHFVTGIGLGGVPTFYQQYRPHWAGGEAEMLFQLHSAPMQIFAELGILGLCTLGLGVFLMARMLGKLFSPDVWSAIAPGDRPWLLGAVFSLTASSILALTDYQLDVIANNGVVILWVAVICSYHHQYVTATSYLKKSLQPAAVTMMVIALLGGLLWLWPVNRAWFLGEAGLKAMARQDLDLSMEKLVMAHQLTPWEPYYSYQLGWHLGEFVLWNNDPTIRDRFAKEGAFWFTQAQKYSPAWEFGYSNGGWLELYGDPAAAQRSFQRALDIMPARRGTLFGLAQSAIALGKEDQALEALALEAVRHPDFFASPLWRQPQWQRWEGKVGERVEAIYGELLTQPALKQTILRQRGFFRWWRGDWQGAKADFRVSGDRLGAFLVDLETPLLRTTFNQLTPEEQTFLSTALQDDQPWAHGIMAFLQPSERETYLSKGFLLSQRVPPTPAQLQERQRSFSGDRSFQQWVKFAPLIRNARIQRVGFNVLSRHMGPSTINDFSVILENEILNDYFPQFFNSSKYFPQLDRSLGNYWLELIR